MSPLTHAVLGFIGSSIYTAFCCWLCYRIGVRHGRWEERKAWISSTGCNGGRVGMSDGCKR